MTTAQIYDLKQSCFRKDAMRFRRILKAAYPETGGMSWAVHNWYRCQESAPEHKTAAALLSSEWARYRKVEALLDRWYSQAEHRRHLAFKSKPSWCNLCNPHL